MKVPLPAVGKNLGEHPLIVLPGFTVNDSSIFPRMDSSEIEKILHGYHNGEGVLTIISQAQSFLTSSKAEPGWPNLWIQINPVIQVDEAEQHINFFNIIGRPQSKGIFTLDTEKYKAGIRDDEQLALIDFKLLSHPGDVESMLDGMTNVSFRNIR